MLVCAVPVCALADDNVDDDGDGYTENEGDCDDGNAALNPDTVWYQDADGDTYYSTS